MASSDRSVSVPVGSTIHSSDGARGLAIIVTNDYGEDQALLARERKGIVLRKLNTTIDGEKMKLALKKLKFAVHWEKNIKRQTFFDLINDLQNFPDYSKLKYETKCIIFVFSGHGGTGDTLYLQDGSLVNLEEHVIKKLLPGKCPSMGELQRLFFIDACRADNDEATPTVTVSKTDPQARGGSECEAVFNHEVKVAKEGDYLLAYSTLPGYSAFEKGDKTGSTWTHLLADEMLKNKGSIEEVLTAVRGKLRDRYRSDGRVGVQQPENRSCLNISVYLHPNASVYLNHNETDRPQPPVDLHPQPQITLPQVPSLPEDLQLKNYPCIKKLKSLGHGFKFEDDPCYSRKYKTTYYKSTVEVTLQDGEVVTADSGTYLVDQYNAKEQAAENVLEKISSVSQDKASKWNPKYTFTNTVNGMSYVCTAKVLVGGSMRTVGGIKHFKSKNAAREDTARLILELVR